MKFESLSRHTIKLKSKKEVIHKPQVEKRYILLIKCYCFKLSTHTHYLSQNIYLNFPFLLSKLSLKIMVKFEL